MASPEDLLQKAAEYVRVAQPQLDAFRRQRDDFAKKASAAAQVLADNGLIEQSAVGIFAKKAAEDPSSVWGFVEKLASSFQADSLGSGAPAGIKAASEEDVDPFVKRFFPGYGSGSGQVSD